MSTSEPGPSQYSTRSISGSTPGVLDPSQPSRVLRWPGSRLSFASFDPRTAFVEKDVPDIRKLSLKEELYRPKRVVVETAQTGESFWRFVPKARTEEGVENEGSWPRVIEICGELVECSWDQWDLYKLDPVYDCIVQAFPKLSVISRVITPEEVPSVSHGSPSSSKRPVPLTPSPRSGNPRPTTRRKSRKTARQIIPSDGEWSSNEEDEVEEMIVDDDEPQRAKSAGAGERAKRFRETIEKNRKSRREKIAKATEKDGMNVKDGEDLSMHDLSEEVTPIGQTRAVPPGSATKRKVSSVFESFRPQEDTDPRDENCRPTHKRYRTGSPTAARREMADRRSERERRKRARIEQRLNGWRQHKHHTFMTEILSEIPESGSQANAETSEQGDPHKGDSSSESDGDEAAARQASIAESRRKLAELEADKPLWEEEARKRAVREQAEEDARNARAAESRRAEAREAEEARRVKKEQEECEAQARIEALKREQQEAARREREKRQRQQRERWGFGTWTLQRALERYKVLSEAFDSTKFSSEEPLTFETVPWPVLHSPIAFSIEDVDWGAVEKFFEAVRPHMRTQDYKVFVETSHRRFHPDRWRSRRLLVSISDEAERGCLEVAANTVAQALTPLWRELKGR